jgi:hypothetical protein
MTHPFDIGTPDWVRTSDLRLRSPLLYPTELPGRTIALRTDDEAYL